MKSFKQFIKEGGIPFPPMQYPDLSNPMFTPKEPDPVKLEPWWKQPHGIDHGTGIPSYEGWVEAGGYDVNGDGVVDRLDYLIWMLNYFGYSWEILKELFPHWFPDDWVPPNDDESDPYYHPYHDPSQYPGDLPDGTKPIYIDPNKPEIIPWFNPEIDPLPYGPGWYLPPEGIKPFGPDPLFPEHYPPEEENK